jgi:hypothetical protein
LRHYAIARVASGQTLKTGPIPLFFFLFHPRGTYYM